MTPNIVQLERVQARAPYLIAICVAALVAAAAIVGFDYPAVVGGALVGLVHCVGTLRWLKLGSMTLMSVSYGLIGIVATKAGHRPLSVWNVVQSAAAYLAFGLAPLLTLRERARAWLSDGAS